MRLQLIAGAVGLGAVAAAAAPAAADPERTDDDAAAAPGPAATETASSVTATARTYVDDDHVTVWSPAADVRFALGDRGWYQVGATIDAISAASVDVVTAASPVEVSELRVELDGRASWRLRPGLDAIAGAVVSEEHDHAGVRGDVGARASIADDNATVEVRLTGGFDRTSDVTDPTFVGHRTSVGALATVAQVVDRRTIVDATLELERSDGWHGSPYRRVPIEDPAMPVAAFVREATPALRQAVAASVRGRRALGERWFAQASVRGYVDDWAMASATGEVALRRQLGARALLGASVRGYRQGGADFYAAHYLAADGAIPTLRSRDRALGPMASAEVTVAADVALTHRRDAPRLLASLGELRLWFFDAPIQQHRRATLATLSINLPWTW